MPKPPAADAKPRPRKRKKKSQRKSQTILTVTSSAPRPGEGVPRGAIIKAPTGGGLPAGVQGPGRGPRPGEGGRPKSILREKLHDIFQARTGIIEKIADGEVVHRTRIRITDILPFVKFDCVNCGAEDAGKEMIQARMLNPIDDMYTTIEGTVSASPKERLAALDLAGKYGPGAVKQIGVEVVRSKVVETLDLLRERLSPEQFESIKAELRGIWVVKAA